MLNKFERYISKNIPSGALALVEKKALTQPYDYSGKPASGKALDNWVGWQQRELVEPHSYNLKNNIEKIGKGIRPHSDARADSQLHFFISEHCTNRKAICFQGQTNHMQSTPMFSRKGFFVIMESIGYYRSNAMLYGRNSEDPWRTWGNRYEMSFDSMKSAVEYARKFGVGVDISYSHQRYHTQKAYADNFNFIKESVSDIEDEEEVVYDIMQKLV